MPLASMDRGFASSFVLWLVITLGLRAGSATELREIKRPTLDPLQALLQETALSYGYDGSSDLTQSILFFDRSYTETRPLAGICVALQHSQDFVPSRENGWSFHELRSAAPRSVRLPVFSKALNTLAACFAPYDVSVAQKTCPGDCQGSRKCLTILVTSPTDEQGMPTLRSETTVGLALVDSLHLPELLALISGTDEILNNPVVMGRLACHEAGHVLGLLHDTPRGQTTGYYEGIAPTLTNPVMGHIYKGETVHWSRGLYHTSMTHAGVQDDVNLLKSVASRYGPDRTALIRLSGTQCFAMGAGVSELDFVNCSHCSFVSENLHISTERHKDGLKVVLKHQPTNDLFRSEQAGLVCADKSVDITGRLTLAGAVTITDSLHRFCAYKSLPVTAPVARTFVALMMQTAILISASILYEMVFRNKIQH